MSAIEAFLAEGRRLNERAQIPFDSLAMGPRELKLLKAASDEYVRWLIENHDRLERLVRIQAEELRKVDAIIGSLECECDTYHGVKCGLHNYGGVGAVEERFARELS